MKQGNLFAGLGGFDIVAEWMGWENIFHCELDNNLRKDLNYYWPKAKSYADIKQTDFTIWKNRIDILTGGDPCQPSSLAGLGKGTDDVRYLWPEMFRAIRECLPPWVVNENVYGSISNGILDIKADDLEIIGYEVQPYCIPAEAVGALHQRERVWLIAYHADSHRDRNESRRISGEEEKEKTLEEKQHQIHFFGESVDLWNIDSDTDFERFEEQYYAKESSSRQETFSRYFGFGINPHGNIPRDFIESGITRMLDGLPEGMDYTKRNKRLQALGNAICPQVYHEIAKIINQVNDTIQA